MVEISFLVHVPSGRGLCHVSGGTNSPEPGSPGVLRVRLPHTY